MLPRTLFATVATVLQMAASMTLSKDVTSGKLLHRERRLLVFPTGTVMQVRSHIARSGTRFFGFERLYVHKTFVRQFELKAYNFTNIREFCTQNAHLPV
jgi:hypothetical protein